MDDKDALDLARTKYGATVTPFAQRPDEPWCRAFTANWLRRRGKGKGLFSEKSKHVEPVVWQNQTVAWKVRFDDAARASQTLATAQWNKPINMENAFKDTPDGQAQRAMFADRSGNKFQQMAVQFKYGTPSTFESEYIERGGFKQRDEGGKRKPPVLQLMLTVSKEPLGADGAGFSNVLWQVRPNACLATIGFDSRLTSHQVAVDCRTPESVMYFDPLLGEFQFKGVKDLVAWWSFCFAKRADEDGCTQDRDGLPTSSFFQIAQYRISDHVVSARGYKPIAPGQHPASGGMTI